MREDTPISVEKIWINIKKFWWICAVTTIFAVLLVIMQTLKEYRADSAAAMRDTYQADSMIYFPTENEDQARTLMTVLSSQQILDKINRVLEAAGQPAFDSGNETLSIDWQGNCFPITVLTEGEERARLVSETATEELLRWAEEHLGKDGQIVNETSIYTCIELSNGNVVTYPLGSQRRVSLSAGSFLGWKKLMIICAGVFCGVAGIFVLLIFDTKLRTKKEVSSVCKYPCLGTIRKASVPEIQAAAAVISRNTKNMEKILYAGYLKNAAMEEVTHIGILAEGKKATVSMHVWREERLQILNEKTIYDGAVIFVALQKDSVASLEMMLEDIHNLGIPIIGYIILEG